MKIAVIGAGYVGLITGVGLASRGHEIVLVETDQEKVAMINQGRPPFFEEGLEPLLQGLSGRNLTATTEIEAAAKASDVIFICVPTYCSEDGSIDLTHIRKTTTDIGKALRDCPACPLIVVKSTVVPGTTENVVSLLLKENSGRTVGNGFRLAVNPEFLKEGKALHDFYHPDRIIIGELNQESGDILAELYQDFGVPILRLDLKTAEMIKYASNAFLATKLSFINEIGNICKMLDIDAYRVAEGMGLDPRISPDFLKAGLGYGGSCLPKDTKALIAVAKMLKYDASLLKAVDKVNERQPLKLIELAKKRCGELKGKKVAVLGLAFKPGTGDIREASSLRILEELWRCGAFVTVYDPLAMPEVRERFGNKIDYASSAEEAVREAELVFIITEWEEFHNPSLYRGKKVFDGRRIFSPEEAAQLDYEGICW